MWLSRRRRLEFFAPFSAHRESEPRTYLVAALGLVTATVGQVAQATGLCDPVRHSCRRDGVDEGCFFTSWIEVEQKYI